MRMRISAQETPFGLSRAHCQYRRYHDRSFMAELLCRGSNRAQARIEGSPAAPRSSTGFRFGHTYGEVEQPCYRCRDAASGVNGHRVGQLPLRLRRRLRLFHHRRANTNRTSGGDNGAAPTTYRCDAADRFTSRAATAIRAKRCMHCSGARFPRADSSAASSGVGHQRDLSVRPTATKCIGVILVTLLLVFLAYS